MIALLSIKAPISKSTIPNIKVKTSTFSNLISWSFFETVDFPSITTIAAFAVAQTVKSCPVISHCSVETQIRDDVSNYAGDVYSLIIPLAVNKSLISSHRKKIIKKII
jgi:hypothetical protein